MMSDEMKDREREREITNERNAKIANAGDRMNLVTR